MEEMLAEFGLIGDGEFKIVTEYELDGLRYQQFLNEGL